jgi:D-glycero-alpha-D-manno-heptose-7-phosphate kinase
MVTVYLGAPHDSSSVHRDVIARLQGTTSSDRLLEPLRQAARGAAHALEAGDLDGYAEALVANTDAQAALHPGLIGQSARAVIDLAARHGAAGWKVNGAGGDGGSVTVIGPADPTELRAALVRTPGLRVLDLRPEQRGLEVSFLGARRRSDPEQNER